MDVKVSIIIPVFKVENYLNKCVDSVLGQSYANIEVILVDDGSPDRSGEICDEYLEKDSRVKVIHQENRGLSGARNTGIENSTGEYLMFIDSDDYIDKSMVEYLLAKSTEFNSDITMCDYCDVIDNDIFYNKYKDSEFVTKGREKYNYLFNEYTIVTVIACNKLYRKHVFDGVRFPVGKTNEDEYVIIDTLYNAERVCYSLKPLYYYVRQRDDSIMNTYSKKKFDFVYAYEHRKEFFDKNRISELRDLTEYSTVMLLIQRMKEYIKLNDEPDKEFIKGILKDTEERIDKLVKSGNLSNRRKLKLFLYAKIPGLYNREIRKFTDK